MEWHRRYLQQAAWTRELRGYLFDHAPLSKGHAILEVGCGTGAVLSTVQTSATIHGVDLDAAALAECRLHAPGARLTCADANHIPYRTGCFDLTYCHFLLLWVQDPVKVLMEMRRVTRQGGTIFAFAEPDYTSRQDGPGQLAILGRWQTEALERQGVNVGVGKGLARSFDQAGIRIVEAGTIKSRGGQALTTEEWDNEWAIMESDLRGRVEREEFRQMKDLDEKARANHTRVLNVPTYFVWGQV